MNALLFQKVWMTEAGIPFTRRMFTWIYSIIKFSCQKNPVGLGIFPIESYTFFSRLAYTTRIAVLRAKTWHFPEQVTNGRQFIKFQMFK